MRAGSATSPDQVKLLLHGQPQRKQPVSSSPQVQRPVSSPINWISPTHAAAAAAAASRPTVVRAGSIASTGRIKLIARRQLQNQQIKFNSATQVQTPGTSRLNWTSPVLAVGSLTASPTATSAFRTYVVFQNRQDQGPSATFAEVNDGLHGVGFVF